jgi:monomeric sarcosine oxidase
VARRRFLRTAGGAAALASLRPRAARGQGPARRAPRPALDVAVVGAGAFGAWTALHLRRAGRSVVLVDAYGPASSRASSGGETRVIRMGYGADETYTRWSQRALPQWKALARQSGLDLFVPTGVLWMARGEDRLTLDSLATISRLGIAHEKLARPELERRFPQIDLGPVTWGILEPESGVLMARRAVGAAVRQGIREGVIYRDARVLPPTGTGPLDDVALSNGERVSAGAFVFACGPWLPTVFPDLLGGRIVPTRQEVFYFGPAAGETRFAPPAMPVWMDFGEEIYGIPDIEAHGFKVAPDRHGPPIDPDVAERTPTPETLAHVRDFVRRRFPALAKAPLVASEVCQYENTSNGDFLIDRHPERANVWLVGGGSGHGFKHGPSVGEYVAARLTDGRPVEAKFSLATKEKARRRTVF